MKKKFIAKLLVLGLALAMLPMAAFAATTGHGPTVPAGATQVGYDAANNIYYWIVNDTNSNVGGGSSTATTPAAPAAADLTKPEEPTTEVTEIAVEGDKAVLDVEVVDGVAYAVVTEDALNVAVEGDTLTLVVKADNADKVFVDLPAAALVKLGKAVTVTSDVATITIPANANGLANAKTVTVAAAISDNGAITVAVLADGKAVKGIKIEL